MAPIPADLPPRTCLVWWAARDAARTQSTALLDPGERARYERFRLPADAERLLVGVSVAKHVLAPLLGRPPVDVVLDRTCPGCGAPHGKPRVAGAELSISHSGDRVVVAVTRGASVGVDVEAAASGSALLRSATAVLTARELESWRQLPPDRRQPALVATWTWKEAVLKATGDGLAIRLTELGVSAPDRPPALVEWTAARPRPPATLYRLSPGDGFAAGLAILDRAPYRVIERDAGPILEAPPDDDGPGNLARSGTLGKDSHSMEPTR